MDYQKEIIEILRQLSSKYSSWQVFNDFVEICACVVNNQFSGMYNTLHTDKEESISYLGYAIHYKEREERYLEVINRYEKDEQALFAEAFDLLVNCLDALAEAGEPEDVLGPIYHDLELHNKYKGQFFTPQNVSDMMAMMVISEKDLEIEKNGYMNLMEPCCGSGVMVTSMAKAIKRAKYDYRIHCCVTAVDSDIKCVQMCFVQLALYGIPAVVIHGNSLTNEEWSRWYTPVYILDKWIWREQCGITSKYHPEDEALKCMEPAWVMYRAMRELFPEKPSAEPVPEVEPETEPEMEEIIELSHPEQLSLNISVEEVKESGVKHIRRQRQKTKIDRPEQLNLFDL